LSVADGVTSSVTLGVTFFDVSLSGACDDIV
jgi:hypothetical protein